MNDSSSTVLETPANLSENLSGTENKKQKKLIQQIAKKIVRDNKRKEERWKNPYTNAKIEDVFMVASFTESLAQNLEILFEFLIEKQVFTEEEIVNYKKNKLEKKQVEK